MVVLASPLLGLLTFAITLSFWDVEFWHAVALGVVVGLIPRVIAHFMHRDWRALKEIAIAPFQIVIGAVLVLLIGAAISLVFGPILDRVLPSPSSDWDACDRYRCR